MPLKRRARREEEIQEFYRTLRRAWPAPHWWPAESPFEVIVGAFLTQNTAWTNVERAMDKLRQAGALSLDGIRRTPLSELEQLVRSAGYFRQKALRLKIFVDWLDTKYGGALETMFAQPTAQLRAELLALNGVGPETADSILLYAGQHEVFVVDAYTRRILDRHQILPESAKYEDIRLLVERALSQHVPAPDADQDFLTLTNTELADPSQSGAPGASHAPSVMSMSKRSPLAQIYNDMHGYIVGIGKNYCLKSLAKCEECPLGKYVDAKRVNRRLRSNRKATVPATTPKQR